jgi:hypothetical protein
MQQRQNEKSVLLRLIAMEWDAFSCVFIVVDFEQHCYGNVASLSRNISCAVGMRRQSVKVASVMFSDAAVRCGVAASVECAKTLILL